MISAGGFLFLIALRYDDLHMIRQDMIETVAQNLLLINDYFKTISSHFLGSYIIIFHEKEIQTVILRG